MERRPVHKEGAYVARATARPTTRLTALQRWGSLIGRGALEGTLGVCTNKCGKWDLLVFFFFFFLVSGFLECHFVVVPAVCIFTLVETRPGLSGVRCTVLHI